MRVALFQFFTEQFDFVVFGAMNLNISASNSIGNRFLSIGNSFLLGETAAGAMANCQQQKRENPEICQRELEISVGGMKGRIGC
jgi:hypothetical protein